MMLPPLRVMATKSSFFSFPLGCWDKRDQVPLRRNPDLPPPRADGGALRGRAESRDGNARSTKNWPNSEIVLAGAPRRARLGPR